MRRAFILLAAATAPLLLGATAAHAAPGGMDDPKGDWTSGSGPLDVKRVAHDNDASTITYTLESYTDFDLNAASFKWSIDCTPTDNRGDNMYVAVRFLGGPGVVADVYHSDKKEKVTTGTVAKTGPIVTVTYPRSAMHSTCASVASYPYAVSASSSQGTGHSDTVPKYPEPKPVHNLGLVPPTTALPTTTVAPTTTTPPTTVAPATTTTTLELTEAAADDDGEGSAAPWLVGGVGFVLLATAVALAVRARSRG